MCYLIHMPLFQKNIHKKISGADEKIVENFIRDHCTVGPGLLVDRTIFRNHLNTTLGYIMPWPKITKYMAKFFEIKQIGYLPDNAHYGRRRYYIGVKCNNVASIRPISAELAARCAGGFFGGKSRFLIKNSENKEVMDVTDDKQVDNNDDIVKSSTVSS